MIAIDVTLHFPKGYIAHPYWPEREKLINIQKESGVNRVRSEERRDKALKSYLAARGLTLEDYLRLEELANRPFYTDESGEIVIPSRQLYGMLAQGAAVAPSSIRPFRTDQVRTVVDLSDFRTGRTKPDGVFERFVLVKSGTGQTLSNQRALRSDPYIADVTATGILRLAPEFAQKVRTFLEWCGTEIGVGAARKMGWGRFNIIEWVEL